MNRRTRRVAALLRGEIGRLMLEKVSDPILGRIGITDLELTNDLKTARIFYTNGSSESPAPDKVILKAFQRATPYMRRKLGEDLNLRVIPQLEFQCDIHGASVTRVLDILDRLAGDEKHLKMGEPCE